MYFKGSIGRTDLPFSNHEDMKNSLKLLINLLPKETNLYPGHGEFSVMEMEMEKNPFLIALKNK